MSFLNNMNNVIEHIEDTSEEIQKLIDCVYKEWLPTENIRN